MVRLAGEGGCGKEEEVVHLFLAVHIYNPHTICACAYNPCKEVEGSIRQNFGHVNNPFFCWLVWSCTDFFEECLC